MVVGGFIPLQYAAGMLDNIPIWEPAIQSDSILLGDTGVHSLPHQERSRDHADILLTAHHEPGLRQPQRSPLALSAIRLAVDGGYCGLGIFLFLYFTASIGLRLRGFWKKLLKAHHKTIAAIAGHASLPSPSSVS